MKDYGPLIFSALFCVCFFGIIFCKESGFREGYKAACRDFYQGNVKAELVEKKDGEGIWIYKNEK